MPHESESNDLLQLQKAAREIFHTALGAVDAHEAIRRAVRLDGATLRICDTHLDVSSRQIYVVAIGKAAPAMAAGLSEILGDRVTAGVISALPPPARPFPAAQSLDFHRWQVFAGGHPLPSQQSLDLARATFDLLHRADNERGLVIFLVSGGGSAMIEYPVSDFITLNDLREANRRLISCGASIAEINAVRRAWSALKGGKLSQRAPHADQITLIVSDTNRGEEAVVASGPTFAPGADAPDPKEVVDRYQLRSALPSSILEVISRTEAAAEAVKEVLTSEPERIRKHYVLLDNQTAVKSAAAKAGQLGFTVEIAEDVIEQEIAVGCDLLISRLLSLWQWAGVKGKPVCLLSGGEFSCPVRGNGIGGRNLETALRCAIEFAEQHRRGNFRSAHLIALSCGTDGLDGNSPAAGAVADETTIARGSSIGLDAERFLEESDSFNFFARLGEAIVIGPTGTNVRDLSVLLAGSTDF